MDSASLATKKSQLFTYQANADEPAAVGDIFIIDFANKQTLGIIRETINSSSKLSYKIKPLGKKINLPTPLPNYYLKLADWLKDYYACSPRSVYSTMLPGGLKAKSLLKASQSGGTPRVLSKLSVDQKRALETIESSDTTLLHGITGSGKTEVYLHAVNKVYKANQSSIILVPEIMLTSQLEEKVRDHFENVLVLHSGLTQALRKKIWLEALARSSSEPLIIIGPRSALFTPLHNLGLIIVDEEHEPSYKQESAPRYEAQIVAAKLRALTNSKLILGSATPSLRTYSLVEAGRIAKAELKSRHQSTLPKTKIVDMKRNKNILSQELRDSINQALENKQQVLLFLNRRGSASAMLCNNCGQAVHCPNCDISLTYHADIGRLVCHYCNFRTSPQAQCSQCKSTDMRFVGDGTKKLEAEVVELWPKAKIARIDGDNNDWKHLKHTYEKMRSSEVDILIGTQMISRGLDIANLSLVGVVDADSTMQIPDFTSSERAYQLISQAAGRAGRREKQGLVIIQTNTPNSAVIKAAANSDYQSFYDLESKHRKDFVYPPFCYLLKLEYAHKNPKLATKHASELLAKLRLIPAIRILGPTSKNRRSLARESVVQIIIKSKSRAALNKISQTLPDNWTLDLDPANLL